MKRCNKCLLTSAYPFISFNSGTCNLCKNPTPQIDSAGALKDILNSLKSQNGNYDCLIGLSGGRDSSYLALQAVRDWELNPLAYCYDNGHMPQETKENVRKVSKELGIKVLIFDSEAERNRKLFKKVFEAWAKHPHFGMIQTFCIGCRSGINKQILRLLHEHNISAILDGANHYEATNYKLNLFGINKGDIEAFSGKANGLHLQLALAVSKELLKNPCYMKSSILYYGAKDFLRGFGAGVQKIHPFFYERYDEERIMREIRDEATVSLLPAYMKVM